MIVEGTYPLPGTPAVVWDLLMDPEVLAKAMPGTKELVRAAPDRYEGVMRVGIGPITAAEFELAITLTEVQPPTSYAMQIEGKGRFGFTRGTARVELVPEGVGAVMRYSADLQVGGKIAAVGQRLLDSVSKLLTRQGLEALNRELTARLGGEPA
ncbi:MAG TPA: carbon monoxide dehydrogenase subunit G [Gemmatimonadales bacterium]|jgi:carbon monoxide dehydrogenase subunit G|nr:carbon monoxide dehydrogenase subunit G [Gemmatimonadales bacterium]